MLLSQVSLFLQLYNYIQFLCQLKSYEFVQHNMFAANIRRVHNF